MMNIFGWALIRAINELLVLNLRFHSDADITFGLTERCNTASAVESDAYKSEYVRSSLTTIRSMSLLAVSPCFATEPYTNAAMILLEYFANTFCSGCTSPTVFSTNPCSSAKIGASGLARKCL